MTGYPKRKSRNKLNHIHQSDDEDNQDDFSSGDDNSKAALQQRGGHSDSCLLIPKLGEPYCRRIRMELLMLNNQ